ncbi:MAG: hypothetical protein JNK21_03615 [Rhodospirillaceae bacterium]|nr:hypothetical protein [Rhodospirillaceae bacterium]
MIRILVTYLVPFLLPLAGYALWIWYRTRYAEKHGGEAPKFEKGPWPLMLFLGALLSLSVLGVSALMTGSAPGDVYVPARVENGKLVPGHTVKPPSATPEQPQ